MLYYPYVIIIQNAAKAGGRPKMTNKELNLYTTGKRELCIANDTISDELFGEYGVNRGLRDINGKGVLAGLTRISKIVSFRDVNGVKTPCDG